MTALVRIVGGLLEIRCYRRRCSTAYGLRHHESFQNLCNNAENDTLRRGWYWIRHYIGRLGSWSVASRFVVAIARQNPQLLENFQVMPVSKIGRTATRVTHEHMSLKRALLRTLSNYNSELHDSKVQALQSASGNYLAARFMENYNDPKFVPRVNAETLMMEHFYFNQLQFFGNGRYIGCSKPSCYCCNLYLRCHPGNFEARPCHGNFGVRWCPPVEVGEGDVNKQNHAAIMQKRMSSTSPATLSLDYSLAHTIAYTCAIQRPRCPGCPSWLRHSYHDHVFR